jgi:hypothetical protein
MESGQNIGGFAMLGILIYALGYLLCFLRRSSREEPPSDEYV